MNLWSWVALSTHFEIAQEGWLPPCPLFEHRYLSVHRKSKTVMPDNIKLLRFNMNGLVFAARTIQWKNISTVHELLSLRSHELRWSATNFRGLYPFPASILKLSISMLKSISIWGFPRTNSWSVPIKVQGSHYSVNKFVSLLGQKCGFPVHVRCTTYV